MWSFSAWRRKRTLARYPISAQQWQAVRERLPMLDGISDAEDHWLREACILFLLDKHLTCLPGVELDDEQRLLLAAQAQLPLLHLGELNWYQGFHEIILYPDDFKSPQRHRDASGVEHVWDGEHSGEAWQQGPIILAWNGVLASGGWEAYNLVIHELAHKLDMRVVAEGVETRAQHDALAAANCDLFQGFLFSQPMSAAQATEFLRR